MKNFPGTAQPWWAVPGAPSALSQPPKVSLHPPLLALPVAGAHCWEKIELLTAWDRKVQLEAATKVKELFDNIGDVTIDMTGSEEDEEAGELGDPFTQVEHDVFLGIAWTVSACVSS